ncbi:MAG: 3-phosphoshikimate 1-carboxyvinyltransferase [Candidatus Nanopelagicaceae bacterium]|nr:3-phosphoshikimate 1-carboxyvinyltransferase [Candidatus Nanopelagicaceae bacterium]
MTDWSAPYRGKFAAGAPASAKPIRATLTIPGSKSVTNRALILAALADSPSRLIRPLSSRDTDLMVAALSSLGVKIQQSKEIWEITPAPLYGPASIDVGNAGTVMRFMLPVAALAKGLINFDGDSRSHERPVGPLIKALEDLGVTINHKNKYALPLLINGAGSIHGGEVEVDASKSSQFLSALLLAGPKMREGLKVINIGKSLPSLPHIEMTIAMLRDFGAEVTVGKEGSRDFYQVSPGGLTGRELVIEPDLSNAAPFMAAPIICGGEVIIKDWPKSTTQPGDRLREIFTEMGAEIEFVKEGLKISGTGKIKGIDIDLHDEGELTPSIAALAALADSPSHLRGIGHLRLHETDRLKALATEINALIRPGGGEVIEESDSLTIKPAPANSTLSVATNNDATSKSKHFFRTYEDHRLATAGAILGLAIRDVVVENIETTRKTLPDFPGLWSSTVE